MTEQQPPEPRIPEPWEAIAGALRVSAGDMLTTALADEIARALADGGWRIARKVPAQPAALDVEILAEALHAQYRLQRPGGQASERLRCPSDGQFHRQSI